jgi:hypothetical protein
MFIATANESGVLYVPFQGQKDGRLRVRMLAVGKPQMTQINFQKVFNTD